MPFAEKLMRLQIGGPLFTDESWSIGFHFVTTGAAPTSENMEAITMAFLNDCVGYGLHGSANLGFIKFNELDHTTGKYKSQTEADATYFEPALNPGGTEGLLPQGATCVTLLTNIQRGRGHSGRVFMPGYGGIEADGHVNPAIATGWASAVVRYLNAVILFDPELTPVVWSKVGDLFHPILGAHAGDVVDTQRRRRSSLKENYYSASLPVD